MTLKSVPSASIMETERSPWCPPAYPSSTPRASKNWLCPNHNPTLKPPTPRQPPPAAEANQAQGAPPKLQPIPKSETQDTTIHASQPTTRQRTPAPNKPTPLNQFHPFWIGTHPQTLTNSPFCPAGTVTNQTPMVNIRPTQIPIASRLTLQLNPQPQNPLILTTPPPHPPTHQYSTPPNNSLPPPSPPPPHNPSHPSPLRSNPSPILLTPLFVADTTPR